MIEILHIRGMKVILDSDLAKLCECETKHVNETRKRSLRKFGSFQLTKEENEPIKQKKMLSKFRTTHVPWVYLIEDALRIAKILTRNIGKKYKEKSFEQDVVNVFNLQSWKLEKEQLYLEGLYPDLLFTNAQNDYLIVEVQIGKIDRYHLYKTLEYRDLFFINYKVKPKVIVACESIPEHYKHIAKIHNIKLITQKFKSCYEISTRNLDTDMICQEITSLFAK